MCGAPDVPSPAQRQNSRMPERQARGGGKSDVLSRKRGYAALMKGSAGGDLSPMSTTAAPAAQKLGA